METIDLPTAEVAVEELIERSAERGYVLLSELQTLHQPELHGDTWIDAAIDTVTDRGIEIIDDVADDTPDHVMADASAALTTDLVRQYLNDAGRHALLTKEDEADLAKRYQAGMAADELLKVQAETLTRATKTRLRSISRDGARAKERMVQANLRLVVPQARKFSGRDLDFIELIQEGNLGLLRAVEKFDHTKGYKFSTYAVWWIRQALQRGVASKGRTIRVPAHVWEMYGKLRAAELRLRQQKGGDPSEAELAEEVGLSVARVREVREAMQELVSLDRPIGEDGDASMGDLIADTSQIDPAHTALEADVYDQIERALGALDERERIILSLRFGLGGQEPETLEEIGAHFGLTRERIRQMQNRALAKLRHPSRSHSLAGLLDVLDRAA